MWRSTGQALTYLGIAKARSERMRAERRGDAETRRPPAKDPLVKPLQSERWRVYVAYMVSIFILTTVVVLSLLAGLLVLFACAGGGPLVGA